MRRVAIIGSGGAGKSTLARRLGEQTGLPVVHLDHVFWRAGWKPAPADESRRDFDEVVAREEWILDGNFLVGPTGEEDPRFERADTIVFVDLPRRACLWRVVSRLVRDRNRARPDLPEGCREGLDFDFLCWVWAYPQATRPHVLELLRRIDGRVDVHHLRSDADVSTFVDSVRGPATSEACS
jgi:adenylate kinase family enzyme